MQITKKIKDHINNKYLKKDYTAFDIVKMINEFKSKGYTVSFMLDCYEQPNTAYIGGYLKPIDFDSPSIWLKNFSSDDIGLIAENVDKYFIFTRICSGRTNSKKTITVFNNINQCEEKA